MDFVTMCLTINSWTLHPAEGDKVLFQLVTNPTIRLFGVNLNVYELNSFFLHIGNNNNCCFLYYHQHLSRATSHFYTAKGISSSSTLVMLGIKLMTFQSEVQQHIHWATPDKQPALRSITRHGNLTKKKFLAGREEKKILQNKTSA